MTSLVLLRHGESVFTAQDRYAGWRDVELSPRGRAQALAAGRLLATAGLESGLELDLAYASWLGRALHTLWLTLLAMDRPWLPHAASWRLNERHCGALEGMVKAEAKARFGAEAVSAWQEGLDSPPPLLAPGDPRHPGLDPRYAGLAPGDLPAGESLAQVLARLRPFWETDLRPCLARGARVLVVGHGVCLWGLARLLAGPGLPRFRLPNANPLLIDLGPDLAPAGLRYLDPARGLPLPELPRP
jgi:2,3-bisphosphoglycerate-dependent phosphoglycerate mutase